jgi:hypothetical protein
MNNKEAKRLLAILYKTEAPEDERLRAWHQLQELVNILIPE